MQRFGRVVWVVVLVVFSGGLSSAKAAPGRPVQAWEGSLTLPTYPWQSDVNPKFWALDDGDFSAVRRSSIIYPYTMQDVLLRQKQPRTYKALFLENEYLKVVCLPELGGRLYAVIDKTTGQPMFYLNHVVKPSLIAMRGAWTSGGVEWNTGPHGHTVTALSPVDALVGRNDDGSAFIEINNVEQIFRTRWTVRVTLRPGRAFLEERIRLYNPTDTMQPYYFWNCTAFPNRPGTRFIFPMSLGTDHFGRQFFNWPVHKGKDLSWLKNHVRYQSIFAVNCTHDFFGAYDVDADRGLVQVADHRRLSGKKAWTWGTWQFGLVAQSNLTDEDGPYIEVQSGPLPTQSDYGGLPPHGQVSWQEWWYPVHGMGGGFEFATRDVAVQTDRADGKLTVRLLATAEFPRAKCRVLDGAKTLAEQFVDLSPRSPRVVQVAGAGNRPVRIVVTAADGTKLADFTSPLPIPKVEPPKGPWLADKPDEQLTAEEAFLRGRAAHRATSRQKARRYYNLALQRDPGLVRALHGLAVLDFESALYHQAARRLEKALQRDPDDGRCWFLLGACRFRQGDWEGALDCAYRAVRCFGTRSLGYDLAGRCYLRQRRFDRAVQAFRRAVQTNGDDLRAANHLLLALYAAGRKDEAEQLARQRLAEDPTDLLPRIVAARLQPDGLTHLREQVRHFVGEVDFETLEAALTLAEVGLVAEAADVVQALCVEGAPAERVNPLVLYYLGYWKHRLGDENAARQLVARAASLPWRDFVFPSRPEALAPLTYALRVDPADANAHLHLGNLLAHLGRLGEAAEHWRRAGELNPQLAMAFRNLGLYTAISLHDSDTAASLYRRAIAARPEDQTLYRDLAEILIAAGKRSEAIRVLESMPPADVRRGDVLMLLAKAYFDERRYDDVIRLLESIPHFINWEGQDATWRLFNRSHVARGRQRFERGQYEAALADFEAALTYPENLNVGRPDRPEEAAAQYWRGRALQALGRLEEARAAWKAGAALPKGSKEQNEYRRRCREALQSLEQEEASQPLEPKQPSQQR